MSEVIGIVAGIGDIAAKKNVIYPDFDAAFRESAFSTDCIVLKGLTIKDGVLQAGYALYKGYVCKLPSNTEWSTSNVYLSLKYNADGQVNGCVFSTVVESVKQNAEKYLETTEFTNVDETANTKDAALTHTYTIEQTLDTSQKPTMTYLSSQVCTQYRGSASLIEQTNSIKVTWALVGIPLNFKTAFVNFELSYYVYSDSVALITNGTPNADYYTYQYPRKAYYADSAINLLEGGSIDANTTATTQPVNDKSMRVATTEFVHNQIANDINAGTANVDVLNGQGQKLFSLSLLRRARLCIVTAGLMDAGQTLLDGLTFTLPDGFKPDVGVVANLTCKGTAQLGATEATYGVYLARIVINADGVAVSTLRYLGLNADTFAGSLYNAFGYECKND